MLYHKNLLIEIDMRVSRASSFLCIVFILTIIASLLNTSKLQSQVIGIEYGITQAGYENALEQPAGLGGHLDIPLFSNIAIPIIEDLDLRFSVSKHTENLTITRSRCTGLVQPGTDCSTDTFDGDSHITQIGAGLVIGFKSLINGLQPEIYAMGISTGLEADFIGRESGKNIGPITPTNKSVGLEIGGILSYAITPYLDIYGRFAIQDTNIQSCGQDAWFAFCKEREFFQFSLGTQVRFSKLRK